jgi:hypothetical protein
MLSGVSFQSDRECRRLQLSLHVADPLALSLRLAMDGVLETLEELFQVHDAGFQGGDPRGIRAASLRRGSRIVGRVCAAHLPYPCDQSFALAHSHCLRASLVTRGARRTRREATAFLGGHLPDDQGSVLDLLAHRLELPLAAFLCALSHRFHPTTPIFCTHACKI